MKREPAGKDLMMWRMAREGFPERVTDELRPEGGDSQAKRGGNVVLQRTMCGWGWGGQGPTRSSEGTKAGLSGGREGQKETE